MTTVVTNRDERVTSSGPYGNVTEGFVTTRNSTGGDRTPAEKAAGLWPDHAYTATRFRTYFGSERLRIYQNFGKILVTDGRVGIGNTTTGLSSTWNANDDITALGRLAGKIRQHDWNAGIFVGELGKTTDTVAGRARQLAKAVVAVKRGNVAQAVAILGAQPGNTKVKSTWYGTWLELRYAWRPLVKDVFDLSDAIRTYDAPRKTVIRAGFTKKSVVGVGSPVNYVNVGSGYLSCYFKYTFTEPPLSLTSHLGLHDPEEVAWELVPYSFVADWFIPIGTYIRTRNVLQKTTGTFVKTRVDRYDVQTDRWNVVNPALTYNSQVRDDANSRERFVQLTRTVGAAAPSVPLPTFRNPAGSNPGTRLLDAIALLRAAVGK